MKKIFLLLGCFSLLCCACNGSDACVSGEQTILPSLESMNSALTSLSLEGDEPANEAYLSIARKLSAKETIRMDIYSLVPSVPADELIKSYTDHNAEARRSRLIAKNGEQTSKLNKNSLFEQVLNEEKHHRTAGVEASELKEDSYYLYNAYSYMENELKPKTNGHYQYYPYKQKKTILHDEKTDQPDYNKETVAQIGVAFASKLDGWPVIGPGGKIYIHMLPNGEIVSHSQYYKIPETAVARLTENDLKTPEEALKELSVMRDIPLDKIQIIRSEFGYYYRGKDSVQNIIAPYYAFFYKDIDAAEGMVPYILIPAVKGQYESLVTEDANMEIQRKQNQLKNLNREGM